MHKSLQMTVFPPTPLLQRGIIFEFTCSLDRTTDKVNNPWYLSSNGKFLGVLSSDFANFQSTQRSSTSEQHWGITMLFLVTLYIEILFYLDKSIYLLLF